jgi:hypothetical protein
MTNTFIPTLSRQPLYCVWIETGNPARPLDRVWIDPELRSFVNVEIAAPNRTTNDESETEALAEPLPAKSLFAEQLFMTPVRKERNESKDVLSDEEALMGCCYRHNHPKHFETREREYNAAFLHQDRVRSRGGCHEEVGRENQWYSSCTVGSGQLISKLLKRMEPTTRVELVTCRLRIGCSTN